MAEAHNLKESTDTNSSIMTKFMSWKWIVKTDDFAHWYNEGAEATQAACAPVAASAVNARNAITCPTQPDCGQPCPTWLGGQDAEAQLPPDYTQQTAPTEEQHILNHLRTSPSLVRAFSTQSAVPAKADEGSTGSKTQADSIDGEATPEKQRYSKKFLWFSALAVCLLIVVIVLLALFLVDRRRKFNLDGDSPVNGLDTNSTENSTSLFDSNSENDATIYPAYDDAYLSSLFGEDGTEEEAEVEVLKFDYTNNSDYLVGTYYYPWYGEDFHRGEGYMRAGLIPAQEPVLGEYDDTDPEVIRQHMAWFRQSNIGLLVTSWWGPNSREDITTNQVIMEHEDVGNLKVALHYETKGRIADYTDTTMIRSDIQHMCENYFDHPNYYSINGRPVLFIHITRSLFREEQLDTVMAIMRSEATNCDKNLFVIGDHAFRSAPDEDLYDPFRYLDAVTNFDVYGSSGKPDGYVGTEGVDEYYTNQAEWKELALTHDCHYIPPVSPGYNDRGVRIENDDPAMSRRLTPDSEEGSLFWYQLQQALPLVSSEVDNLILVNSFNQFHEDTQIEPVMTAVLEGISTNRPPFLTGGYDYEAYGELYLDLLGAATSNDPTERVFFDGLYSV